MNNTNNTNIINITIQLSSNTEKKSNFGIYKPFSKYSFLKFSYGPHMALISLP